MPYKNDELDNLFKKAGGNYPLRTDSSNWENVVEKLNIAAKKQLIAKNRFLKYTVIVLLLSGSLLVFNELQLHSVNIIKKAAQNYKQQPNSKELIEQSSGVMKEEAHMQVNNKPDLNFKEFISGRNHTATASATNSRQPNISSTINNLVINSGKTIDEFVSADNIKEKDEAVKLPGDDEIFDNKYNENITSNAITGNDNKSINQTVKYKSAPLKFYGILYGSPEFSMVKFQHISNPGYRAGIALGYRLNNRFNVEIGLQRDQINYYTAGKYFDKSGLKLKDAVSLETVDGKSKLTSVPVTIKYNFLHKENRHFYVAAGTNAVVLSHAESYEYTVSKNGNLDNRAKNYKSVTGPKYFSSINAAAGYQGKLCNWFNFNVEPYYQIPIKGIGVGKLPVTCFGVNLGIVKDLK